MKLLWAVSALLLGCWRANASTGKNFLSAMLVEDVDFALTTNIKNGHSDFCLDNVATIMLFAVEYLPFLTATVNTKHIQR